MAICCFSRSIYSRHPLTGTDLHRSSETLIFRKMALILTLSACGTPKRGLSTYRNQSKRSIARVFGGSSKYTWTGGR